MAILWSLCRKTTTFWREVRTMAIILRLLQVCSSLLLARMLAMPYPTHTVLPLCLSLTPYHSWRDTHIHTCTQTGREGERERKSHTLHSQAYSAQHAPMFRHIYKHATMSAFAVSSTNLSTCIHRDTSRTTTKNTQWCKGAGQDETLTFSSTRTFTRALRLQSQKIKEITCDGTLQSQRRIVKKREIKRKIWKKTETSVERKSDSKQGVERGTHELHWSREACRTVLTFYCRW